MGRQPELPAVVIISGAEGANGIGRDHGRAILRQLIHDRLATTNYERAGGYRRQLVLSFETTGPVAEGRPGGRHSKSPGVEAPRTLSPDHEAGDPLTARSPTTPPSSDSSVIDTRQAHAQ